MFKKITDKVFLDRFLKVIKTDDNIRLLASNGSRTNKQVEKDEFQDFDLVLVVEDFDDRYICDQWMEQFSDILIYQIPDMGDVINRKAILVQYENGHRIDLTVLPISVLDVYLEEDSLTEILLDKDNRVDFPVVASDKGYWIEKPTQQQFQRSINEFWWVSMYVMKGICRKEYFYAVDHISHILLPELMKVVGWEVGYHHDWSINLGKSYKFIDQFINQELSRTLLELNQLGSPKEILNSFLRMLELYEAYSMKLAKELDYAEEDYKKVKCKIIEVIESYMF